MSNDYATRSDLRRFGRPFIFIAMALSGLIALRIATARPAIYFQHG